MPCFIPIHPASGRGGRVRHELPKRVAEIPRALAAPPNAATEAPSASSKVPSAPSKVPSASSEAPRVVSEDLFALQTMFFGTLEQFCGLCLLAAVGVVIAAARRCTTTVRRGIVVWAELM